MVNGRIQDNPVALRNKGGCFKTSLAIKSFSLFRVKLNYFLIIMFIKKRPKDVDNYISLHSSLPTCVVDYERIALKNRRRKLEFFKQKGNCVYSGCSNLMLHG